MRRRLGAICGEHNAWDCEECKKTRVLKGQKFPSVHSFRGHFNHCLGEYVGSKGDLKSGQSRVFDESRGKTVLEEAAPNEQYALEDFNEKARKRGQKKVRKALLDSVRAFT